MFILLPLLGSALKSWYMLLQKRVLSLGVNEYVAVWSITFGALAMSLLLPFLPAPNFDMVVWTVCAGSAICWFSADILDAKALRSMPVSIVLPIYSLGLVFTGIAAWLLLGEIPSFAGIVGVICIITGTYLVDLETVTLGTAFLPFKTLFSRKGTWLIIVSLPLYAFSSILDKIGVIRSGNAVAYSIINHLTAMLFLTLIFYNKLIAGKKHIVDHKGSLMMLGLLNLGFATISMHLYTFMNVVYVVALFQLSVLFNVIGGRVFFKERNIPHRLLASAFVIVGSILLFIA